LPPPGLAFGKHEDRLHGPQRAFAVVQNAFGKPAWRRMALAVWRLGMPIGTAKFRLVIGLCQISWLSLSLPDEHAASSAQQFPQRSIELRRHSGGCGLGFA